MGLPVQYLPPRVEDLSSAVGARDLVAIVEADLAQDAILDGLQRLLEGDGGSGGGGCTREMQIGD